MTSGSVKFAAHLLAEVTASIDGGSHELGVDHMASEGVDHRVSLPKKMMKLDERDVDCTTIPIYICIVYHLILVVLSGKLTVCYGNWTSRNR